MPKVTGLLKLWMIWVSGDMFFSAIGFLPFDKIVGYSIDNLNTLFFVWIAIKCGFVRVYPSGPAPVTQEAGNGR